MAAEHIHEVLRKSPERWDLGEGDRIAPRRTALRRLGGGHRYDAYLAWDERMLAIVVCKIVRPHLINDPHTLEGLAGEWEMLQRLNHPVVLRGYDAVLEGQKPHLVLEHLEGPRLSSLTRRYGPLPVDQLVPLALQLASAVHYLGEEKVVHLDLKPSNTIMGAPPRVIDLSVAKAEPEAAALTSAVGTDAYMAPEQCLPATLGPVGRPADVWGLGATLYAAATGEPPFGPSADPDGAPEARWPQLRGGRPDLSAISGELAEVIDACLAPDPGQRPSPHEVHERLEPVLDNLPRPRISRLKPRL